MALKAIVIKNTSGSTVFVDDLGYRYDNNTTTSYDDAQRLRLIYNSNDLFVLVEAGTLTVNDGTSDLSIADALNYLDINEDKTLDLNFSSVKPAGESILIESDLDNSKMIPTGVRLDGDNSVTSTVTKLAAAGSIGNSGGDTVSLAMTSGQLLDTVITFSAFSKFLATKIGVKFGAGGGIARLVLKGGSGNNVNIFEEVIETQASSVNPQVVNLESPVLIESGTSFLYEIVALNSSVNVIGDSNNPLNPYIEFLGHEITEVTPLDTSYQPPPFIRNKYTRPGSVDIAKGHPIAFYSNFDDVIENVSDTTKFFKPNGVVRTALTANDGEVSQFDFVDGIAVAGTLSVGARVYWSRTVLTADGSGGSTYWTVNVNQSTDNLTYGHVQTVTDAANGQANVLFDIRGH